MTQLLPDPPLSMLPELPENLRWYIDAPDKYEYLDYKPLRRVYIQERRVERTKILKREVVRWTNPAWSVWSVRDGFGDFSLVGTDRGYATKGLASACHHAMREYEEQVNARARGFDFGAVHGASKQ